MLFPLKKLHTFNGLLIYLSFGSTQILCTGVLRSLFCSETLQKYPSARGTLSITGVVEYKNYFNVVMTQQTILDMVSQINLQNTGTLFWHSHPGGGGGGGVLLLILWMCHWMGSHFHDSTDYNGSSFQAFSIKLLVKNGVALFQDLESKIIICLKVTKMKLAVKQARKQVVIPKSD